MRILRPELAADKLHIDPGKAVADQIAPHSVVTIADPDLASKHVITPCRIAQDEGQDEQRPHQRESLALRRGRGLPERYLRWNDVRPEADPQAAVQPPIGLLFYPSPVIPPTREPFSKHTNNGRVEDSALWPIMNGSFELPATLGRRVAANR
jgi:hypothetical protein